MQPKCFVLVCAAWQGSGISEPDEIETHSPQPAAAPFLESLEDAPPKPRISNKLVRQRMLDMGQRDLQAYMVRRSTDIPYYSCRFQASII